MTGGLAEQVLYNARQRRELPTLHRGGAEKKAPWAKQLYRSRRMPRDFTFGL